jgi:hypothetical protein
MAADLKNRKESIGLLLWIFGFVAVYVLFFPIKGDQFFHFIPVYCYFAASLILIWTWYLIGKTMSAAFAIKAAKLVLITAVGFPVGSYYYNGRMHFIRNAAEFNHPAVLNLFLDESNQAELDMALYYAKAGKNAEIVEALQAKGAK